MTRQQRRAERFRREFENVRIEHGLNGRQSGQFTYAEGMTRKAARRIARRRSKG